MGKHGGKRRRHLSHRCRDAGAHRGPVPGAGTGGELAIPESAVFKSFKDPVIDRGGLVAFIATIAGKV
jgi:hypothetical protein